MQWFAILLVPITLFCTSSAIFYAGMKIECEEECGDLDSEEMQTIGWVFHSAIQEAFKECCPFLIDHCFTSYGVLFRSNFWNGEVICTWLTSSYDSLSYSVYDWRATQGKWKYGNFTKEVSIFNYLDFLDAANLLREDLYFYYLTAPRIEKESYQVFIQKLRKAHEEGYDAFTRNGDEIEFCNVLFGNWIDNGIKLQIDCLNSQIQNIEEGWLKREEDYENARRVVEDAIQDIDHRFKHIFVWCLKHHQPEGVAFNGALQNFLSGNFSEAFDQILFLIKLAEERKLDSNLISKLYLLKGQVQSEFCLYADAIIALTTAIQKNPMNKEAYFERAVSYFELGEFDKSIEDYLKSDFLNEPANTKLLWNEIPPLSAGIAFGIIQGTGESLADFVPSLLSSARGLGMGLWAFCSRPVGASHDFVNAAVQCVEYLRKSTPLTVVQDMVPELKELIESFDELTAYRKGQFIGQVISRYGMDVFLCKSSVETIRFYRDLKKANQMMTLEALTSAERRQILEVTGRRWDLREKAISKELKIHEGRQNKHVPGKSNYKPGKSILEHPNPQRLIHEFAGTGIKEGNELPGMAGYKEIVNFEEFIGYSTSKDGKNTATTWGKIHYAKDGVHIVPTLPPKK